MKDIDRKIEKLVRLKELQTKLELHIRLVKEKLESRLEERAKLEDKLTKVLSTLSELDELSAPELFAQSLGNNEEQFQRQRQEFLINFLKLRTCEERIDTKSYEIEVLDRKLGSLITVDDQLSKLLYQKKQFLKIKNPELRDKIVNLEGSIRLLDQELREIDEASSSSQTAFAALTILSNKLAKITSWRSDAYSFSRRAPLSYKEKSYSRDLIVDIRKANIALDNFLDELNDVSNRYDLDYQRYLSRLAHFVDHIFDGLISDWIFYQQIKTSKENVDQTIDHVKRIAGMLKLDRRVVEQRRVGVQEQLEKLVQRHSSNGL